MMGQRYRPSRPRFHACSLDACLRGEGATHGFLVPQSRVVPTALEALAAAQALDQATQQPPQLMCVFRDDGIVTHSIDGSIVPAQSHRNRRTFLEQTVQLRVKLSQFPIHG